MNALLQSEFCGRLCLALGHSLWQAGAVAAVVSVAAIALRRRSANVRYNLYLAGLLVSLATFPVTLVMLKAPRSAVVVPRIEVVADTELQTPMTTTMTAPPPAAPITAQPPAALPQSSFAPPPSLLGPPALRRFVPWIAAAYLAGVCAMALRLALGMWSATRLSRRATLAAEPLRERLAQLAQPWRLRVVPRLAVSAEVVVPKVVGLLRPVILLPLSATTGLAPDQLDMILAHELAHVRRHDLWVNLVQRVAETVLFFNPAIWYLSRRLTTLREFACDELVCKGTDAPTTRYAAALVRVAELSRPRAAAEIAAVAATGRSPSELRRRVARLVGEPLREPVRLTPGGVIMLAAVATAVLLGPGIWSSNAEPPAKEETANENESVKDKRPDSPVSSVRTLRSGGKIELLAIGTHREEPSRWWCGDGTPLTDVAFSLEGPQARPNDNAIARQLVFQLDGVSEDAIVRTEIKPVNGITSQVVWQGKALQDNCRGLVFLVPKDRFTFQLRVGVASGKWQTINKSEPLGSQATGIAGGHGVVFSEAYAKGDDTVVIVSHNMENENTRVVAVDLAGSEFVGERAGYVSAVGEVNQAAWKFPDLLPESIKEFKFQTRLFLWVEFDELPAEADAAKPAVEFSDERRSSDTKLASDSHEFALRVVGPDGKSVPHVTVGIRTRPGPSAEELLEGELLRTGPYGATVKTGADGRLVLRLPAQPDNFAVSIKQPGYGPYYAKWNSDVSPQKIPREFTAELEAAWSIGSVIVDDQGNPIEGVKVQPWIPSKLRPGDNDEIGSGMEAKTDAVGRWRIDSVPNSMNEVHFEISHPKYKPLRRLLVREEFAVAQGEIPSKQIAMEQGLIVTGTVTDDAGKPIAGALVRTKFLNDIREAKTDDSGTYQLIGCEPRMARVVISAKGKALDMQEVRVAADMEPVDFQMQPGGKVRVRVVDENGKPIPKTRIFFQRWRGRIDYFEFDHVNDRTDENGIWEWNEAPLDEFQADICRPNGMQLTYQSLIARNEEYVFRPPPALVVSGSVIDAETKKPIAKFRVVPGIRSDVGPPTQWFQQLSFDASAGRYQYRQDRGYPAHFVRIEADGYQAAVSREIESDEGNVTIDFALEKGRTVAPIVWTPDGSPAAGAKVAIGVAGSQISVENGDIDDGSTYAARRDTDKAGQFSLPPQDTNFQIVVTHPSGYAHIKGTPDNLPGKIQLIPWARVEGTFRVGKEPQANVALTLNTDTVHSYGEGVASIFTHHDVTTGPGGRFAFPRVFPGDGWVGRDIVFMVDDGATEVTSTARIKAHFPAGETTHMDLGGEGQPVIGRLEPPDNFDGKVFWNFALISVQSDPPAPVHPKMPVEVQALPEKRRAWWIDFLQTDEGKASRPIFKAYDAVRSASPYFTASVAPDGTFRIDDMLEGEYQLSVRFSKHGPGRIQGLRFMVPPIDGEPFDLGVLKLER